MPSGAVENFSVFFLNNKQDTVVSFFDDGGLLFLQDRLDLIDRRVVEPDLIDGTLQVI